MPNPDSAEGKGKLPGCTLELNKTLNRFGDDAVLLGDDGLGDNEGDCSLLGFAMRESESLGIDCFCRAAAECWARRICALAT